MNTEKTCCECGDDFYGRDAICGKCPKEMDFCPECEKDVPLGTKSWTTDRYGNPWRKVCGDCYDSVQDAISGYTFDSDDAGESLDGEDNDYGSRFDY